MGFIYEPVNFAECVSEIDPELHDGVRWLVNYCYFMRVALWKDKDKERWAFISNESLQSVVGKKVKQIREAAEKAGLIESNHHYRVGNYPMGYRLGEKTKDQQFRRWKGEGQVFLNRYKRFRAEFNCVNHLDPLGRYMHAWIKKVGFDDKVDSVADSHPGEKGKLRKRQIIVLKEGFIRAKYDSQGRFYSNVTQMCKDIRHHLCIQGEILCEIDVRSSQLLFLTEFLLTHSVPYSHYDGSFSDGFYASVEEGTTYEQFQRHHGIGSREEAKQALLMSVYGYPWMTRPFLEVWPKTGERILAVKRQHGYKYLPCEMQRREAKAILRGAVDRLRLEHPKVPILTVHDSVLTTSANLDLVHDYLSQALAYLPIPAVIRQKG